MKLIFTLLFLFSVAAEIPAQKISDEAKVALNHFNQKPFTIKTGCTTRQEIDYGRSLLVIDGVPDESAVPQDLNADDIASIDVLKKEALGTFGCRNWRDIILVTTKSPSERKFIVKDFLNGNKIPSATLRFVSGNETIMELANDSGVVITGKLIAGRQYTVTVSSTGYKTLLTTAIGKEQEILLEKDIRTCGEVVVVAYPPCRCPRLLSCSHKSAPKDELKKDTTTGNKIARSSNRASTASIYPNPIQRNNSIYIELKNDKDETLQLSVYSLNGNQVLQQPEKIIKGYNRLSITADAKWAAGMYVVQLKDQKGKTIKQEKLIVQ